MYRGICEILSDFIVEKYQDKVGMFQNGIQELLLSDIMTPSSIKGSNLVIHKDSNEKPFAFEFSQWPCPLPSVFLHWKSCSIFQWTQSQKFNQNYYQHNTQPYFLVDEEVNLMHQLCDHIMQNEYDTFAKEKSNWGLSSLLLNEEDDDGGGRGRVDGWDGLVICEGHLISITSTPRINLNFDVVKILASFPYLHHVSLKLGNMEVMELSVPIGLNTISLSFHQSIPHIDPMSLANASHMICGRKGVMLSGSGLQCLFHVMIA